MGTRSGDLDPPCRFSSQNGRSAWRRGQPSLNHQSGLLGLSGRSSDMRDLLIAEAAGDSRATLAVEAFSYRARKYVGSYLAALGGADAIVFGGGIGENSAEIRRRVCADLDWAGLALDTAANETNLAEARRISSPDSGIEAWVVPVTSL